MTVVRTRESQILDAKSSALDAWSYVRAFENKISNLERSSRSNSFVHPAFKSYVKQVSTNSRTRPKWADRLTRGLTNLANEESHIASQIEQLLSGKIDKISPYKPLTSISPPKTAAVSAPERFLESNPVLQEIYGNVTKVTHAVNKWYVGNSESAEILRRILQGTSAAAELALTVWDVVSFVGKAAPIIAMGPVGVLAVGAAAVVLYGPEIYTAAARLINATTGSNFETTDPVTKAIENSAFADQFSGIGTIVGNAKKVLNVVKSPRASVVRFANDSIIYAATTETGTADVYDDVAETASSTRKFHSTFMTAPAS